MEDIMNEKENCTEHETMVQSNDSENQGNKGNAIRIWKKKLVHWKQEARQCPPDFVSLVSHEE